MKVCVFLFFFIPEENLMMSIAADTTNSTSDSGRDSPRTPSLLSNTWCTSCSSWPEERELKPLWGADACTTLAPQSGPSMFEPGGLYRRASLVSLDSMASTLLPSISPDSGRSPSATRIGTEGSAQSSTTACTAQSLPIYPLILAKFLLVTYVGNRSASVTKKWMTY